MRLLALLLLPSLLSAAEFAFQPNDRIVIVGNTFAERMVQFGDIEAAIVARLPNHQLSVRNLGWSGDEIWAGNATPDGNAWSVDGLTSQLRPLNFGDQKTHLAEQKADVVVACYGMNESFAGPDKLPTFEKSLGAWVDAQVAANYSGKGAPRVVLVSPIYHETLGGLAPDPAPHNQNLRAYVEAMRKIAAAKGVAFLDLFHPTEKLMTENKGPKLTINGIHLNADGYKTVAGIITEALKLKSGPAPDKLSKVLEAIHEKNLWFFRRYHALNGEYIYGRRNEPFGVINFPPEMQQLDTLVEKQDAAIWTLLKAAAPAPARE